MFFPLLFTQRHGKLHKLPQSAEVFTYFSDKNQHTKMLSPHANRARAGKEVKVDVDVGGG